MIYINFGVEKEDEGSEEARIYRSTTTTQPVWY